MHVSYDKNSTYSKIEIDSLMLANNEVFIKSVYTKEERDDILSDNSIAYIRYQTDLLLSQKVDVQLVYAKKKLIVFKSGDPLYAECKRKAGTSWIDPCTEDETTPRHKQ